MQGKSNSKATFSATIVVPPKNTVSVFDSNVV